MKNQLYFFAFVLMLITTNSGSLFSQTKEQELSNAEKFSAKSGALIQKEFIEVGYVKGIKMYIVYYIDLITNTKQSALKLEYDYVGKYSTATTKVAVLDSDEVEGLLKSITIIQEKIFPSTASNYTEVTFRCRGGFEAGCYWSKNTWSTYLKLEKYDKDSYVFLTKEDFPTLLSFLEKAKAKL
jgi:hypothetical protein